MGRTAQRLLLGFGAAAVVAVQLWLVALASGLTHRAATDLSVVLPLITLLPLSTLLALFLVRSGAREWRGATAIMVMAGFGLLLRLVWFSAPAPIEDDYYRYFWDGAMVANGLSPYTASPQDILSGVDAGQLDPAVAGLAADGRDALQRINFPALRTIYPLTAQAAFAAAFWIEPWSLDALRFVLLMAEIATLLLSAILLRRLNASPLWAGLYWCNPFVATVLVGAAHVDALIAPFLLAALMAIHAGRRITSGFALALAAGVKIWPLLLAPLLLRASGNRLPAWFAFTLPFALLTALLITPLILSGVDEGAGLHAYATGWANNNAVFEYLHAALAALTGEETAGIWLRFAFAVLGASIALALAVRSPNGLADLTTRTLIISATVFYCSPAQFPWYAAWFLPLAAIMRAWPLVAVSALLPAYYLFFPLWETPVQPLFFYAVALIHWLPLLWLLITHSQQLKDRFSLRPSPAR